MLGGEAANTNFIVFGVFAEGHDSAEFFFIWCKTTITCSVTHSLCHGQLT
jgi:hypothetical protein